MPECELLANSTSGDGCIDFDVTIEQLLDGFIYENVRVECCSKCFWNRYYNEGVSILETRDELETQRIVEETAKRLVWGDTDKKT